MGQNGGKRPGAGRPKGSRDKGKAAVEAIAKLNGKTPIEIWTQIIQDAEMPLDLRLMCCRDLAPYVHAKLSSTEVKAKIMHEEELDVLSRVAPNGHQHGKAI